jgi:fused signal recognition particle receptor
MFGRLFGGRAADPTDKVPGEQNSRELRREVSEPAAPDSRGLATSSTVLETVEPALAVAEPVAPPQSEQPDAAPGQSWFARLKSGLTKTSSRLTEGITGLFTKKKLDADTIEDLEDLLIQADLGVETAMRITETLSRSRYEKGISADDVRAVLAKEVGAVLKPVARPLSVRTDLKPHVILVVGVNGTGKTTTIGKLAAQFRRQGRRVTLVAGDTFRAAAIDQLKIWGERTGCDVVARSVGADSSGLAFDALKSAKQAGSDVLIIDTAGRLQNKQALMDELEKLVRVLRKIDSAAPHDVLLVLDATTGQNALNQVEVFRERVGVTGLIMTKLDGTARGGILVAIAAKFGLPVHAVGVGEGIDDLQPFDAEEFARAIALS